MAAGYVQTLPKIIDIVEVNPKPACLLVEPLWPGNRGIVIEDNTIRNFSSAGIFVAVARDVQIRGNRLENCFYRPGKLAGKGSRRLNRYTTCGGCRRRKQRDHRSG